MSKTYKFEFDKGIKAKLIENKVHLAIRSAEHAFGKPRVRLSVRYAVRKNKAIIHVWNEIGEYIVRVFVGFMGEEVGENGFKFEPVNTEL
ncbi:MAG TPA: hypothetical protein PLV52_01700 [Candidatus Omnitrophota bacterium]|nr:hypothetical protein [Candidatus Omnitrophota bacterium]